MVKVQGRGVGMCVLASPSCQVSQVDWKSSCGLVPSAGAYVLLWVFFDANNGRWETTVFSFCSETGSGVAQAGLGPPVCRGLFKLLTSLAFRLSEWDHRHVLPCPTVWCSGSRTLTRIPTSVGEAVIPVTWEAEAEGL